MKTKIILLLLLAILIPSMSLASFDSDLFYGIKNNSQVLELQELLTSENLYTGPITGNFFSLTLQAVKKFQERENIKPVEGYFGTLTREKANQILSKNLVNYPNQISENVQATDKSVISKLKSQIESLLLNVKSLQSDLSKTQQSTQTQTQKTNNIITLPNGSVVEVDSNGQIIKYLTQNNNISNNTATVQTEQKTEASTFQLITTKNNQTAKPGSNNYEIASFKITNYKDIEISNIQFLIKLFGNGENVSDITNLVLIDSNGAVVCGPVDATGNSEGSISFRDTVTLKKGSMIYSLRGNLSNNLTENQTIYITANKDKWLVKEPEQKVAVISTFSASDMFVTIIDRNNQQNSDGSFNVAMVLESSTDLSELNVKVIKQGDNSNSLTQKAHRQANTNLYDIIFSQLQPDTYDIHLIADASRLPIGISKIFKETHVVQ